VTDPVIAFRPVAPAAALLEELPPAERVLLGDAATPKRRSEFAAGRAAARAAVARLLRDPSVCTAVVRDVTAGTSRPVAVDAAGGRLPAFVSITHTEGVAAAAAAFAPVGVDLVRLEPLDGAFRREAFWPEELASFERGLAGRRPGAAACAAFGAKEAVVKWLGTGLTIPLLGVRMRLARSAARSRLGGVEAIRFALSLDAPLRCDLRAWVAEIGSYVLVAVTHDGILIRERTIPARAT
jgi:4'-phosphopantetheinyl transferase